MYEFLIEGRPEVLKPTALLSIYLQNEIARGASEDQAVAAVKLDQYAKLNAFGAQREVVLRRMYKKLKGTLP